MANIQEKTGTITADKLCALTGFTLSELVALARKGLFQPPRRGLFGMESISGCFRALQAERAKAGDLPTYPSMSACEGGAHVPLILQKRAKREGCNAFTGAGRVNLEKLLIWLFTHDDRGEFIDYAFERARRERGEANKIEREEAEAEKRLMPVEVFDDLLRQMLVPIREAMIALPAEMAGEVNPADPQLARQKLVEWTERILASARERKLNGE